MDKRTFTESRTRRTPISLDQSTVVRELDAPANARGPLTIQPVVPGVKLHIWISAHRDHIEDLLVRNGAIRFNGFTVNGAEQFQEVVNAASNDVLEYMERSSPRSSVLANIYTSTDYPASEQIFFHNENSYQRSWPMKLLFYCQSPASTGGATPLADTRATLAAISPQTLKRFERLGVMYVRNFGSGLGLSWQTVFQTEDRATVERYCKSAGIEFDWLPDDVLRTRQIRPAVLTHPVSKESVWFNHGAFFHITSLDAVTREGLLTALGEQNLPTNTYFGDGSPIDDQTAEELRQAYKSNATRFAWEQGDVLLIDNMLTSHARESFTGHRRVLVAMAQNSKAYDSF
jgi:alpha-ketoglutarate-dependent taurine dioxygenase